MADRRGAEEPARLAAARSSLLLFVSIAIYRTNKWAHLIQETPEEHSLVYIFSPLWLYRYSCHWPSCHPKPDATAAR